jgi:uncharacterized protein with GYD domain
LGGTAFSTAVEAELENCRGRQNYSGGQRDMSTYLTTIQFTEKGIESIRDTGKRATAFRAAAKKAGVKVVSLYWTLGSYDGLLILEAPDDETLTAALLDLSSAGNVRTKTVRAFDASEMSSILAKLGG